MAISNTTNWRIRTGGSDTNGGGYDASVAAALSTTLSAAITAGQTTITVASASGWPTSGSYYADINTGLIEPAGGGSEIVLVTGGQGTTTWTVTRAQLGTTALAFASGVAVNNDLSRANTAAANGTNGAASGTTTFTDSTTNAFNGTEPGNVIWLQAVSGGTA